MAAGYVLYGASTMLVYSTGDGVHGFTYDPAVGEFFLSQPDIKCPTRGACFSVNEGNYSRWSPEVQKWSRWIEGEGTTRARRDAGPWPLGGIRRRVRRAGQATAGCQQTGDDLRIRQRDVVILVEVIEPDDFVASEHELTGFISNPDFFSFSVAFVAGVTVRAEDAVSNW